MLRHNLKEMLKAGFLRFLNEGFSHWTEADVEKAINPLGEQNKLRDPPIQRILKELESEGIIELNCQHFYLRVLPDTTERPKT